MVVLLVEVDVVLPNYFMPVVMATVMVPVKLEVPIIMRIDGSGE